MQPCFRIEVLPREPQINRNAKTLRRCVAKGFAFPAPRNRLIWVSCQPRCVQVIGMNVVDRLGLIAVDVDLGYGLTLQPQLVPYRGAGATCFTDQVPY